jgi:hypothetical protein
VPLELSVENADGSKFVLNFKLSFDFNAMALVEQETGLSMLTGSVFQRRTANMTKVLLWAAIQENHPEYEGAEGLSVVGSLLDLESATKALVAINDAFLASLPKEKAEQLRKDAETEENSKPKEGDDPNVQSAS